MVEGRSLRPEFIIAPEISLSTPFSKIFLAHCLTIGVLLAASESGIGWLQWASVAFAAGYIVYAVKVITEAHK